jgi:hypothetical protein
MTRVDLRIDLGGEPVSGSLAIAGAEATPFSGYTGLIAALEALRLQSRDQENNREEERV